MAKQHVIALRGANYAVEKIPEHVRLMISIGSAGHIFVYLQPVDNSGKVCWLGSGKTLQDAVDAALAERDAALASPETWMAQAYERASKDAA